MEIHEKLLFSNNFHLKLAPITEQFYRFFHRDIASLFKSLAWFNDLSGFPNNANIQFPSISLHTEYSEMPAFINELI